MSNLDLFKFAVGVSRLSIDVQDMAFEEERQRRNEQNIRTIEQFDPADEAERCEEIEYDGAERLAD